MAITYPIDFLTDFPGWSTEFEPLYRQEQSRQANGRTIVKDLGSPLWRASYQSRMLLPGELDSWRARLASLENGLKTFKGRPIARSRPIAHQGSGALPTGELHTIDANRKAIRVDDLVGITLSVGDYLSIGDDLHQVMESASGTLTDLFEVRPHIWPGVVTGVAVSISKSHCVMAIVPGSVNSPTDLTGRGTISFQAVEAR